MLSITFFKGGKKNSSTPVYLKFFLYCSEGFLKNLNFKLSLYHSSKIAPSISLVYETVEDYMAVNMSRVSGVFQKR